MSKKRQINATPVLNVKNLSKTYKQGKEELHILNGINLTIYEGELIGLVGPSGCGKSTLLQILGLLDGADTGTMSIFDTACEHASDRLRTQIRKDHIGFIYQAHHLLMDFTAVENVMIPQIIQGVPKEAAKQQAMEVLAYLGLEDRFEHRPGALSGGEQQRVAIARAIVNRPSLILADEPTGNLDPETAEVVFQLLLKVAKTIGLAVLTVTHDPGLAKRMDRTLVLEGGKITEASG